MSEKEVQVSLQNILNKTSERLYDSIVHDWNENNQYDLKMEVSIGFDSSSGHLNPHQKSENQDDDFTSAQQSLFTSCFNIIKLVSDLDDNCIWINPTPQSVRFTRPLRMCFEKENDAAIHKGYDRLQNEIENLRRHRFKLSNGKTVRIKFRINLTLFDGKCVNTLVDNRATSRCPICLYTAHEFGNLKNKFTPNQKALSFGLGLLHAEIKLFEHLQNLSYRLPFKQWDITSNLRGKS